jgi:hypothetical protein
MMRAMHGSTVLYPSDATSTASLVAQMAERSGVVYMRTTRGPSDYCLRPALVRRATMDRHRSRPSAYRAPAQHGRPSARPDALVSHDVRYPDLP